MPHYRSWMALALGATRPASALLPLVALAGIVALLLPNFAEPRVLLTLDDFGAVGDGIADDTQALQGWHRIRVQGITLQNAQQSTLTFTQSSNVRANYLRVTSPEHSSKTNGIHLIDSYNVRIMENLISTGMKRLRLRLHLKWQTDPNYTIVRLYQCLYVSKH